MTDHTPTARRTLDFDGVERLLTGGGMRPVGTVNIADCTYCSICSALIADRDSHSDFHAGVLVLLRELRRQHETR